ncbi:MAG: hypothetical protein IT288_04415 [Bdellovibrionales bacterium]|nr:hypothetical protein [Bdellovibrionales bacterium]
MVAKVVQPREALRWLKKSWRIFRKKPLYLCGVFGLFALFGLFPSSFSPFARIFSGFLLPILVAGTYLLVFRIVRYKALTWWDLFFAFSESRLAVRLMPASFFSMLAWSLIGAAEYMYRQPLKYEMTLEFHNTVVILATTFNLFIIFGVTPVMLFSQHNFIQAVALTVRAVRLNFVVVLILWGSGILLYDLSRKFYVPYIPVGTLLMLTWYNAFDGMFLISEDPLAGAVQAHPARPDPSLNFTGSVPQVIREHQPVDPNLELPDSTDDVRITGSYDDSDSKS